MPLPVLSLLISLSLALFSFGAKDVGSFAPAAFAEASDRTPGLAHREADKRIDVSTIPVVHALVMGSRAASKKVIIFTDPD